MIITRYHSTKNRTFLLSRAVARVINSDFQSSYHIKRKLMLLLTVKIMSQSWLSFPGQMTPSKHLGNLPGNGHLFLWIDALPKEESQKSNTLFFLPAVPLLRMMVWGHACTRVKWYISCGESSKRRQSGDKKLYVTFFSIKIQLRSARIFFKFFISNVILYLFWIIAAVIKLNIVNLVKLESSFFNRLWESNSRPSNFYFVTLSTRPKLSHFWMDLLRYFYDKKLGPT